MKIVEGFVPGAIGQIAEMHGRYYAREWSMGINFEAQVAMGCAEFATRYKPPEDLVLLAQSDDTVVASLILDLHDPASDGRGGHLRYFILADEVRGTGIGSQMLQRAIDHLDAHCEGRGWLNTFSGLDAARHMYEKFGFSLTQEAKGNRWGYPLVDQTFERKPLL